MSEMNYHGQMMNILTDSGKLAAAVAEAADRERVYQYGHRDARHAAAEIAAEADARIAELEAQLERAREAGATAVKALTWFATALVILGQAAIAGDAGDKEREECE